MRPGDIVNHKNIKHLVHGRIITISKSGLRAYVEFHKDYNPQLMHSAHAYYKLDLLEGKDEG